LRVSPLRGTKRFDVKGKLSSRYVGPYLIAIIEVRGEEVLASTLDGYRRWRRGPGVPGGSELC
jgi:hypothetical protein